MAKLLYSASDGHKLEAGVKEDVKKWLAAHNIYNIRDIKRAETVNGFYYMPVQNGMGLTGVSDFIICYHGIMIALETKASNVKAKPTPDQKAFLDAIEKAGGFALTVNSVEMLEAWFLKEFLQG